MDEGAILKINLNGLRNKDYEELRSIFGIISDSIGHDAKLGRHSLGWGFAIVEMVKNAFVHGNHLNRELPIYIKINKRKKTIEVYDLNLYSLGMEPDREVMKASYGILHGGIGHGSLGEILINPQKGSTH